MRKFRHAALFVLTALLGYGLALAVVPYGQNSGNHSVPATTIPVGILPTGIPATSIGGGAVSNTEFGYLDGVTSALQTQLSAKQSTLSFPLALTLGGTGQDNSVGGAVVGFFGGPHGGAAGAASFRVLAADDFPSGAILPSPALSGTNTGSLTAVGFTLGSNLAAGSYKITGLAAATASGDALSYPPVSSISGSTSGGYVISATIGTYVDTGITVTLPSAGTYRVFADVRTLVKPAVVGTFGSYISFKLTDNTNSVDLARSIKLGAYATIAATNAYATTHTESTYTVSGATVIDIWAVRQAAAGSFTTSNIVDDGDGSTVLGYEKKNYE